MLDEKAVKLLSLALHPNTPLEESKSAGAFFIQHCRRHRMSVNDFVKVQTVNVYKDIPTDAGSMRMPFGKHKGTSLKDLVEKHPDYCDWLIRCATLPDKMMKYLQNQMSDA